MLCNLPCRIVLVIVNTLTFIVGIVLLAVGAIMVWGKDAVHGLLSSFITPLLKALNIGADATQISELLSRVLTTTAPIGMTLFCLGASCAILSAIGYCGACCNYKIVLYLYVILIGLLALAVLICVIVYFALKDKLGNQAVKLYAKSVTAYVSLQKNTVDSLIVGLLQPPLRCCGVDSPSDFKNMSTTDIYNGVVYEDLKHPIPCCMMNEKYEITGENCPKQFNNENSYISQGCRDPLKTNFIKYMNYAAYGLIATFGILVALIIFTIITIRVDVI